MNNILIDNSDERIRSLIGSIDRIRSSVSVLRQDARKRPFNNEVYITDRELSERLKVSRRTLQEWRYNKVIPYIQIASKILYRERDVQLILEKQMRNVSK